MAKRTSKIPQTDKAERDRLDLERLKEIFSRSPGPYRFDRDDYIFVGDVFKPQLLRLCQRLLPSRLQDDGFSVGLVFLMQVVVRYEDRFGMPVQTWIRNRVSERLIQWCGAELNRENKFRCVTFDLQIHPAKVQPCVLEYDETAARLLMKLKPIDQAIVRLMMEGYSMERVASQLSMTAVNVKTRICRFRKRMSGLGTL